MSDVAVAPAPVAASPSAPAPAAAPVSTPAATPATPNVIGNSGVASAVDPGKFRVKNDYAQAVLAEQMAAIGVEEPAAEVAPVAEAEVAPVEVPAVPDAEPEAEVKPAEVPVAEEPDFQLEPEAIVTPEFLTQMVTDNPDFGKLLEADPKLKGQLYKTAREAAELQPYREIFPDLESAKSAVSSATTFNDVRNVFMGSTTKEGTIAALNKIAELSYERDDNGEVVMQDGNPVIGQDFYSFVDHTVAIDLEHRKAEIQARFDANQYHVGAQTQEDADNAYQADATRLSILDEMLGDVVDAPKDTEQLPPHLKQKAAEIERKEREINERQHGEKKAERQKFESEMQVEAKKRLEDPIGRIIANVEKQGAVISPYLKNILPKAIASKVIQKISSNPVLQDQMAALQRLPMDSQARERRLAAIDRAYQMYIGDVAREELREAGVQLANAGKAKAERVSGQIDATNKSEIRGSTGRVTQSNAPMEANAAYEYAQAEWQKANPGKRFDISARNSILGRVVNLQLTGAR